MIYTTLKAIRKYGPCREGWVKLLAHLGKTQADDEPLALAVILESNGVADALWCLRAVPDETRRWRLLAVRIARRMQHLMTDERSVKALDVAEYPCHVMDIRDGLVFVQTELSKGAVLQSSIIGFTVVD